MEVEYKVFELIDLFLRDSSLGQFQSRLNFISLLYKHFSTKKPSTPAMSVRLTHILNIMHYTLHYYSQFKDKLAQTINRLDQESRDKIKTLIDVSKWTVQKFNIVKNNIDKKHK